MITTTNLNNLFQNATDACDNLTNGSAANPKTFRSSTASAIKAIEILHKACNEIWGPGDLDIENRDPLEYYALADTVQKTHFLVSQLSKNFASGLASMLLNAQEIAPLHKDYFVEVFVFISKHFEIYSVKKDMLKRQGIDLADASHHLMFTGYQFCHQINSLSISECSSILRTILSDAITLLSNLGDNVDAPLQDSRQLNSIFSRAHEAIGYVCTALYDKFPSRDTIPPTIEGVLTTLEKIATIYASGKHFLLSMKFKEKFLALKNEVNGLDEALKTQSSEQKQEQ